MSDPFNVTCPHCGAKPGDPCVTVPRGNVVHPHLARHDVAQLTPEPDPKPLKIARLPLPHKLRHRVRAHGYVWCDHHCGIHDASIDSFGEGADECKPINWRRVYIETDDRKETF